MFLINKKDKTDVIELIDSGPGYCIIIQQKESLKTKNPIGKIIKKSKKELKKDYKKLKDNDKRILFRATKEQKEVILETFETDKIGILQYTEDYINYHKRKEREEEIKQLQEMSEEEYRKMLQELADK